MQIHRIFSALRRPTSLRCVYQPSSTTSNRTQQFSSPPKSQINDPATALQDDLFPGKSPRPPQSSAVASRRPGEAADSSNPFLSVFPSTSPSSSRDKKNPKRGDLREILLQNSRKNPGPKQMARQKAQQTASQVHALESQSMRVWTGGDIVAPHDLSPIEQVKARRANLAQRDSRLARTTNSRSKRTKDIFDQLGINPLKEYKNFAMMSEFITDSGGIRHSRVTGLRAVNQRKMAKAVRRAVGMGLMPSVHKHPELLEERMSQRGQSGRFK